MRASFSIATGGVLTLFIAAPLIAGSVWMRVADEVSGTVFVDKLKIVDHGNTLTHHGFAHIYGRIENAEHSFYLPSFPTLMAGRIHKSPPSLQR